MFIKKIKLRHFKNINSAEIEFEPSLNVFTGHNGAGKTNILDAIFTVLFTKSAFGHADSNLIQQDASFFRIECEVERKDLYKLEMTFSNASKKTLVVDGVPLDRLSQHIGEFPVVMVDPDGVDLIRGGSDARRRFFDALFSQKDKVYLDSLIKYHHVLKQRNAYLKARAETNMRLDVALLTSYDQYLVPLNIALGKRREILLQQLEPMVLACYREISDNAEKVGFQYVSDIYESDFEKRFYQNREKDVALTRTELGIHTDDYLFFINNLEIKKFASQGQRKTFLVALKLAELDFIYDIKQFYPVLLLDDIFDKFDDQRISALLNFILGKKNLQIFITDARPERTHQLLNRLNVGYKSFFVSEGKIQAKN